MKILNKKGLRLIETKFDRGTVISNDVSAIVKISFPTLPILQKGMELLKNNKIKFDVLGTSQISFEQTEAFKLFHEEELKECTSEERVWRSAGGLLVYTNTMDQQRLSNCVGLLEVLLSKGKISKEDSEIYLENLKSSVMPELEERFAGVILSYVPHYEWERKLVEE